MQQMTIKYIDGGEKAVYTAMPDRIAWDMTRTRRAWPKLEDAPFLAIAFMAWNALRRETIANGGEKTATFDDWYLTVEDIETSDPEEDELSLTTATTPTA